MTSFGLTQGRCHDDVVCISMDLWFKNSSHHKNILGSQMGGAAIILSKGGIFNTPTRPQVLEVQYFFAGTFTS